jgi:hypothetical protein
MRNRAETGWWWVIDPPYPLVVIRIFYKEEIGARIFV